MGHPVGSISSVNETPELPSPRAPVYQAVSPESNTSRVQRRPGSATNGLASPSAYRRTTPYQPYPAVHDGTRHSTSPTFTHSADRSRPSTPQSASISSDNDGKERGKCPHADCGRIVRDLKAHMLTHQSERPEKCPIPSCEFYIKGFARKYDKNRHTLTHYKGTMVCGFCPGSGSAAEKSFNRADVFKRHLTSVHNVEQTPPNSRKKTTRSASFPQNATGKCSTCSGTFNNAQEFYNHLDDCVLRIVQQEDPLEAINEKNLSSVTRDEAVLETLRSHALPVDGDAGIEGYQKAENPINDDGDAREDVEQWNPGPAGDGRSGAGSIRRSENSQSQSTQRSLGPHVGGGNRISKSGPPPKGASAKSAKGAAAMIGKGRKKRKHFPLAWGCSADKMKMKRRVLCVYDGPRRLCKDDMMLDREFEVRVPLADGNSYVTDLDVQTLKRAEGFHNATEGEKGPWESDELNYTELLA